MNTIGPKPPEEDHRLQPGKFEDPAITVDGQARATVALTGLKTLWLNTGTLCNLECRNCYIESSPRNDRLVYLRADEAAAYFDEIAALETPTETIGITGGEPFMNPDIVAILTDALDRGFRVLVLTNAMKPMWRHKPALLTLLARHGARLKIRASLDHYSREIHEMERGEGAWVPAVEGVKWLSDNGFVLAVAGRTFLGEHEANVRDGYGRFFAFEGIALDAHDPAQLVLLPEMDETLDVPEITTACWQILAKDPDDVMCATERMVVKRKGAAHPVVLPCTLLPYDMRFEMGRTLSDARGDVPLNHPHCSRFCVLGGGSCSAG